MSKQAKKTFGHWLRSLIVAAIGGGVTELVYRMTDPHTFFDNPREMAFRIGTGAVIAVVSYYQRSPLTQVWPDEEPELVDPQGVPVKKDEGN